MASGCPARNTGTSKQIPAKTMVCPGSAYGGSWRLFLGQDVKLVPSSKFASALSAPRPREPRTGEGRKGASDRGPLARIEVLGLLHAVLERKAGEGFFRRVAPQPCPLFFGDPESGFYPRFPLRRPREEVLRFLVEALRFHNLILAQGA